jgi:hypothetical protein
MPCVGTLPWALSAAIEEDGRFRGSAAGKGILNLVGPQITQINADRSGPELICANLRESADKIARVDIR